MPINDRELKQAALVGLRHERQRMDELIARLERELGTGAVTSAAAEARPARRKRRMSAAGRANIIAALKKRWAAVRKAKAAAAKPKAAKKTAATIAKSRTTRKANASKRTAPNAAMKQSPAPAAVAEVSEVPVE